MIPDNDTDYALLARVFAGEASDADRLVFERWRTADPSREAVTVQLRQAWERTGQVMAPNIDSALSEIHDRIARRTDGRFVRRRSLERFAVSPSMNWSFAAAAALILAIGVGGYFWRAGRSVDSPVVTASAPTEVATTRGQRAVVQLSDGSRVTLGVASRLTYPRDFGVNAREVTLEGEAYFDVRHDQRVPFRVRTSHGVTEDIGTRFSVRAYAGETTSRVVVEEGSVSVAPDVILQPGDVARVAVGHAPVVHHGVDVSALLSWKEGHLEFVDAPLRDVAADLARWYDVRVRIQDSVLARRTITASFRDAPVADVLAFVARVLDARVEERGGVHVIVPAHHASAR